jgi:hypothetical protein
MADQISFLEPLKTLHENRSSDVFSEFTIFLAHQIYANGITVQAFVVEIPAKLTSKALRYGKSFD